MDLENLWTVEEEIDEIRRIGRSKKQKEDGMKSRKVKNGIENVGRTRRIWIMESRNVKTDGENLTPVDVARGTSVDGAVRSRDAECRRKQKQ
jgi:hypothetical protein